MKDTPTAVIFLDGVKPADIKRFQQLLESKESNKAIKNMTFVIMGNTGLADTLMNQEVVKALLTTAVKRDMKLGKFRNRKSRRSKK